MVLAGKQVLVTGGLGFFGGHLIKRLLDEKCKIVVTDLNIHTPNSYFWEQKLDKEVVLETCDIGDFSQINSIIVKYETNVIFHLAAHALVNDAYYNPLEAIRANVIGTANVLESCRIYGKVDAIHVASTDKAYGKLPRVDENKPISGDHPYEVSKTSADLIARSYFKTYKLPVVVTRFGNVYGESDLNFSRIIPGIMKAIIENETLKIRSNGKYLRDYVYAGDVVDATLLLVKNIKKTQGEAFNISSFENLSVVDVVKKVDAILGTKISLKIMSTAKNEIPIQSVNFNKIKKAYGWKPKNNFQTTIPGIYAWYKNYFDSSRSDNGLVVQ